MDNFNVPPTPRNAYAAFGIVFRLKNIKEVFEKKIRIKMGRGIDRISPTKFAEEKHKNCSIIYQKCKKGTYYFSPYVELLQSKGRGKAPRVISYPTVRDRIVLQLLKEFLHQVFPECVNRKLPNNFVREVCHFAAKEGNDLHFFQTDISKFYDNIYHPTLMKKLSKKIRSKKILNLILRAITTKTVPANYRKKDFPQTKRDTGVPQGLAISNILANIYIFECDQEFTLLGEKYTRYVDDLFFFAKEGDIGFIEGEVQKQFKQLGLEINKEKTRHGSITEQFDYLGYRFERPLITVKSSTQERFLQSFSSLFASYKHNSENKRKQFTWLTKDIIKKVFVEDLNEKVTGAISGSKRYGWIFYFSEINDMTLLYKLDAVIRNFFTRLSDFGHTPPEELKSLVRAYYEIKYNPFGGYIHNYDVYDSTSKQLAYLNDRGFLNPKESYTPEQIESMFIGRMRTQLSTLERDIGIIS